MSLDKSVAETENNTDRIDIIEDDICKLGSGILETLLKDKTTGKNIMWCTKDYEENGPGYNENDQILIDSITHKGARIIQPRAAKSKDVQERRVRKRAEVFTPSWICNEQNNLVDEAWFGRANVFNTPEGKGWKVTPGKIEFEEHVRTWKAYVRANRLEITCGEAPYIVSRYDTTTGNPIPLNERIGLFDRKMRVVNENCEDGEEWLKWARKALQSVYGYEFQGDSLLIARENLLYDYLDYYKAKFGAEPEYKVLTDVANIIAWNLWQMDGLKGVVPYSCKELEAPKTLNDDTCFDSETGAILLDAIEIKETEKTPCPGCAKNDMFSHTGIYCRIFDWKDEKKSISFLSLFQGGMKYGTI